jgi:glycosyltransferase involved in cell wall biosynthesis
MEKYLIKLINNQSSSSNPVVLILITGLRVGGAERMVLELAGHLPFSGIQSVVVTINADPHMFSMLEQYSEAAFPVYTLLVQKNPWSLIKGVIKLIGIIHTENISLIHAHMFHSLLLALIFKMVRPDLPIVFTSHNAKGFSWLRRTIIRMTRAMRVADIIFIAGQHPEMNAVNTVVIPNGVPVDPAKVIVTKEKSSRRIFLFAGRLEPQKDPIALIQAFAAMRKKNCELWMAGDGIMRHDVEREIDKLGIKDRVRLLGLRNDMPQLLVQADCFVMSSRWEGLPMAVLEAGAIGLPVVATPVGALPTVLDGDCGFLVETSQLQRALDEVVNDYAEASRRGKRLRDKVINHYSLEHMAKAHANLYSSLISKKTKLSETE